MNDVTFSPSELRIASAGGDGIIKIWDPRDGSYVRRLTGHDSAVFVVRYTSSEQFLISAGGDAIFIWNLLTQTIQRKLRGHVDVINSLSIVSDGSLLVSASQDHSLKTWCTTPRRPVAPDAPKIISFTERTVYLSWVAPPSFNCDLLAFHIQQRVGSRGEWTPSEGLSVAPHLRHRVMEHIIPATSYQFRVSAENAMGRSDWSAPSVLVRTAYGLPEPVEQPWVSRVTRTSLHILWFAPNPATFGAAATSFEVQVSGDGKDYELSPKIVISLEEVRQYGEYVHTIFRRVQERRDNLAKKLVKSQQFSMKTRQTSADKEEYEISRGLSNELIFEVSSSCLIISKDSIMNILTEQNYMYRFWNVVRMLLLSSLDAKYRTFDLVSSSLFE